MIKLEHVFKTYITGDNKVEALVDVSLQIKEGEFVAIMGPSGSGKSTLLHVLGLLDKIDKGNYKLGDLDITNLPKDNYPMLRKRTIGFIFQQFHLLSQINALDNVELPLIYEGKKNRQELAWDKLKLVDLTSRAQHKPSQLSGGQQQRVAIARALVNDPLTILADEPTGNLDSKSEGEIIGILEKLNKQGKTVIIVTHEEDIASHCKRIIRMRDGRIISDVYNKQDNAIDQDSDKVEQATKYQSKHSAMQKIEFISHFIQAGKAIFSHKLRSFLSMLGILIGVASVIVMLALGQGAKDSISKSFAALGTNRIVIRPGIGKMGSHEVIEPKKVIYFVMRDVEEIRKLPYIRNAMAMVAGAVRIIYGNRNWQTDIQGSEVMFPQMCSLEVKYGRFFTENELKRRDKVIVLGATVAKELFQDANPIGKIVKVNKISFKVIGVLPSRGAAGWHDQDDMVVLPITTAMDRVLGKDKIDFIMVDVDNPKAIEDAKSAITDFLIKRYRVDTKEETPFTIVDMSEILKALQTSSNTMGLLLAAIAIVSLLVGGIGIMNIMLVSVRERTKEIGIRKAIGATDNDILMQFLIEAVFMTLSGGILGIILGSLSSVIISNFLGWIMSVSLFSVILAVTFAIGVGIFFGIWPARQAAKLNPIEALRYE